MRSAPPGARRRILFVPGVCGTERRRGPLTGSARGTPRLSQRGRDAPPAAPGLDLVQLGHRRSDWEHRLPAVGPPAEAEKLRPLPGPRVVDRARLAGARTG